MTFIFCLLLAFCLGPSQALLQGAPPPERPTGIGKDGHADLATGVPRVCPVDDDAAASERRQSSKINEDSPSAPLVQTQ